LQKSQIDCNKITQKSRWDRWNERLRLRAQNPDSGGLPSPTQNPTPHLWLLLLKR